MMADLNRLFALVAPFTLLTNVAIGLFGPPPAESLVAMTGGQMFWQLLLPSLFAAVGQLTAAALIMRPDAPPRAALATALAAWPSFVAVQLLVSVPVGIGFLVLILPGIWLFARLAFLPGAMLVRRRSRPAEVVRDSWDCTQADAVQLALFILIGLFAVIGIDLIAQIAGSALESVCRLAGLAGFGRFLHVLLPAMGTCFTTIGFGVASALACQRLIR